MNPTPPTTLEILANSLKNNKHHNKLYLEQLKVLISEMENA